MQYIHRDMNEDFLTLSSYPETMYKKVTLLKYFRDYMSEHLLKVIMLYYTILYLTSIRTILLTANYIKEIYIISLLPFYYRLVEQLVRGRLMMVFVFLF